MFFLKKNKIIILYISFFAILGAGFFSKDFIYYKIREIKYNNAYQTFFLKNSSLVTQNFLLNDIDNNINDNYTKFSAFLVIYSYFNNGGNIYEVVNYINNHKELSFLKEAEIIYPSYFDDVYQRKLPFSYSDQGMYVSLAYFEILDKYGYADIDTIGILAGQYAKMAYYKRMILEDKKKGKSLDYPNYTEEQIKYDVNKATFFIKKSEKQISDILDNYEKKEEYYSFNVIKGLVEYASALRYLESLGVPMGSTRSSKEIFDFLTMYSHKFAPEFYYFVSLSNASTVIILEETKENNIILKNALYPFISFDLKIKESSFYVDRVLSAKYDNYISRFADITIYSKPSIVSMAKKVPEFKKWLLGNGWDENDF